MRYEVRQENGFYKVWDTENKFWITKDCPDKETADEICHDFNEMERKNFTSSGFPDFSRKHKK